MQTCPSCNEALRVPGSADADEELDTYSFFTWVERTLMKMILGVPRFIFWVIPREVFLFLERAFPWLVRLVRVCILFVVWLAIVSWPFALNHGYRGFAFDQLGYPDPWSIDINHGWFVVFCWTWLALSICGSFWGIAYSVIRKRRRRKKKEAELAGP